MPEYLVLMKLNPGKIVDTLGDIRKLEDKPVSGVDLCYSMNIFGAWDVGIWINAENSSEVLESPTYTQCQRFRMETALNLEKAQKNRRPL